MNNDNVNIIRYAEIQYTYSQSQQLNMQTGCIGYLRADFGNDEAFFSSWNDISSSLKTDKFKAAFDDLINSLREEGSFLHSRKALSGFCYENSDSRINDREFGFRIDDGEYTFLMRLNPHKGEYNLYCYCYEREWLNRHMQEASRGIRFITPEYKDLFRLPDGEAINIISSDGRQRRETCRYIDIAHLEVGRNLYHICEFAELLEQSGSRCEPVNSAYPPMCYALDSETQMLASVCRYRAGLELSGSCCTQEEIDKANAVLGVTKAQAAAMKAGALKGWCSPAADVNRYDENGVFIRKRDMER